MLSFSQCTDGGLTSQGPSSSQFLSNALGSCRLGDAGVPLSLQLPDFDEDPLRDATNMQDAPQCSQLYSQLLCTPDFLTPVEQQADALGPKPSFRTPAALSPSRVKRPRSYAGSSDSDADVCMSQSQPIVAMGPPPGMPTARKMMRAVRQKSPVCLRNVFAGDAPAEDDEINKTLCGLPKAQPPTSKFRSEFKELGTLGCGNFSKVLWVKHRLDGMEYAVKRSLREVNRDPDKRQWIQEIHAWARLPVHPHIVQYYGAWMEPANSGEHIYIQLQKCGPSLGQHTCLDERLSEADLIQVLVQVSQALQHMHKCGIAHMDVKPDNIYTCEDGSYKLGDMGLATQAKTSSEFNISEGDCKYVAAEVLNDDYRNLDKADMFALGATLYELALGSPLPTDGAQYQALRQGKLQLLTNVTQPFQKMLKALMHPDAEKRPSPWKVLASALVQRRASDAASEQNGSHGGLYLQPSQC